MDNSQIKVWKMLAMQDLQEYYEKKSIVKTKIVSKMKLIKNYDYNKLKKFIYNIKKNAIHKKNLA